jgi:hypothetical protein
MLQSPLQTTESPLSRWQFSIRGLLLFTASVAVGISFGLTKLESWSIYGFTCNDGKAIMTGWCGGLIGFIVFWMVVGIACQIRDLWSYLRTAPPIDKEQKCSLRCEIYWRVGIIPILLFVAIFAACLDREFFKLACLEEDWGYYNEVYREPIVLLLLMVIVWNVPQAEVKPKRPLFHRGVNLLAWTVLIVLAYNRWQEETVVPAMLNIATVTMDMAFPLKYSAIDPLHLPRKMHFLLPMVASFCGTGPFKLALFAAIVAAMVGGNRPPMDMGRFIGCRRFGDRQFCGLDLDAWASRNFPLSCGSGNSTTSQLLDRHGGDVPCFDYGDGL